MAETVRVAFACEFSERVGLGHLARARALAEEVAALGATAILVSPPAEPVPPAWLRVFGVTTSAIPDDVDAVVVDAPSAPLEAVRAAAPHAVLVTIDDGPGRALDADLVVNPNLGATEAGYDVPPGTAILAGAPYALLPRSVGEARALVPPVAAQGTKVLVTCGASDPQGLTERYLASLTGMSLSVRVAIGPLNARADALVRLCQEAGVEHILGATSLVDDALWADIALSALGVTAAELACIGVPNIAAAVTETQVPHLNRYRDLGLVVSLGWHADLTTADVRATVASVLADGQGREALRRSGRTLVDGEGARRVAEAVLARLSPDATPTSR